MINNCPKISIITPSFNSAKYIEDCIQSVLNQNYPNFEHIIVDGGSTDGTIEILKKYPHLKWISEPDEGQSDALNKGFKMASGEIIGWLNADEYYLSNVFELVANFFKHTTKVDIIYGDYRAISESGFVIKNFYLIEFSKWINLFKFYIPTVSTFFRKRIIDEGFFLEKNFHYAMDKEWILRMAFNGKRFEYIPVMIGNFRWHSKNKSLQREKQSSESVKIVRKYGPPFVKYFPKIFFDLFYYVINIIFKIKRIKHTLKS